MAAGLDRRDAEATIRAGVRVAREVRDELAGELGRELLVAASVGPYGAYLADGSEYRGRYGVPAATLRDFHAPRLELLAEAGPDLLAVETVPDSDEAEVLVPLLEAIGLPAWFSYAVVGSTTRAGQPLEEAYAVVAGCAPLVAVGVNCSAPRDVTGALQVAHAVTGKPGVAYPNLGERWDNDDPQLGGRGRVRRGARAGLGRGRRRLVGGCCRVGPDRIARLRAALASGS